MLKVRSRMLNPMAAALLLFALNIGANAATKYWIGSGSFSDNSHWSTTSGGGNDTTAPAAADLAVFDDGGTGDCTIDASISVQGLNIASGYPGTISQGAAITVGKDGYAQSGGTFLGGADDVTVQYFTLNSGTFKAPNGLLTASRSYIQSGGIFIPGAGDMVVSSSAGPGSFMLSGGSFTAPTDSLSIVCSNAGDIVVFTWTGGAFNHNDGTIRFRSIYNKYGNYYHRFQLGAEPLELHNLIFSGGNYDLNTSRTLYYDLGSNGKLVVEKSLLFESDDLGETNASFRLNQGVVELRGDLTVNPGMLGGTTAIKFTGSDDQIYICNGGFLVNTVIVDKATGTVEPGLDPMDFPAISFVLEEGTFKAPNGLLTASRSYIQSGGTFTPGAGDMLVGSSAGPGSFMLSGGSFTAPTDSLSIICSNAGDIVVFTWTGGAFNHNDGTIRLRSIYNKYGNYYHRFQLGAEPLELHNLIFSGGNYDLNTSRTLYYDLGSNGKLVVEKSLLFESDDLGETNASFRLNQGVVELRGDLTITPGIIGGTTAFTLTGTNEQSLTHTGGTPPTNPWTIDKTEGKVSLATDLTLSGAAQDIYLKQGELNLDENRFTVGRNLIATGDGLSALGVRVADADTAGLLVVSNNLTGIENLDLNVAVSAPSAEVKNRSYQIVTNKTDLSDEFKSVNWASPWKGKVDYSLGEGREAWLYDLEKKGGTVIMLR